MIRLDAEKTPRNSEARTTRMCQHYRVREIGKDFDKNGSILTLERCETCGLLMREYSDVV